MKFHFNESRNEINREPGAAASARASTINRAQQLPIKPTCQERERRTDGHASASIGIHLCIPAFTQR